MKTLTTLRQCLIHIMFTPLPSLSKKSARKHEYVPIWKKTFLEYSYKVYIRKKKNSS